MYCYMKKCMRTAINTLLGLEKELKGALEELQIVSYCGVVEGGLSDVGQCIKPDMHAVAPSSQVN